MTSSVSGWWLAHTRLGEINEREHQVTSRVRSTCSSESACACTRFPAYHTPPDRGVNQSCPVLKRRNASWM